MIISKLSPSLFIAVASSIHHTATADADGEKTYIVSFANRDLPPAERCATVANSNGGTVKYVYDEVLNGCALTMPVTAGLSDNDGDTLDVAALGDFPDMNFIVEDQPVYLDPVEVQEQGSEFTDSIPTRKLQTYTAPSWGLDRINQCALPLDYVATKQNAAGVKVFILDSGIYGQHSEFAGILGPPECHYAAYIGAPALSDTKGHG